VSPSRAGRGAGAGLVALGLARPADASRRIQAVATDLRSGTAYDDRHAADELLDLVGTEAERLDRDRRNLLSLSRIEAGTLEPDRQAVDLGELVASSAERMERVLEGLAVSLDVASDLPLVPADYSQSTRS
jgi:two-component system sensor histidine kinase KdpD